MIDENQNSVSAEEDTEDTQEFQDGLPQFFGTVKDIVARYTRCGICGAHLHFSHVTNFAQNLTQEMARCPECGTKARQMLHRLQ